MAEAYISPTHETQDRVLWVWRGLTWGGEGTEWVPQSVCREVMITSKNSDSEASWPEPAHSPPTYSCQTQCLFCVPQFPLLESGGSNGSYPWGCGTPTTLSPVPGTLRWQVPS